MPRLVIASLFVVLAACGREGAVLPTGDDEAAGPEPAQESWDVRFTVYESPTGDDATRPRMEMRAGYMAVYEQGDTTYTVLQSEADTTAGRVTAFLFDTAGDTSATIRANRIRYYDRSRQFEARGAVVVDTREGRHLESETLFWNERSRRVRSPGFTRLTTPSEQVQGYDLVADENLDFYTLARVTGKGTFEDE